MKIEAIGTAVFTSGWRTSHEVPSDLPEDHELFLSLQAFVDRYGKTSPFYTAVKARFVGFGEPVVVQTVPPHGIFTLSMWNELKGNVMHNRVKNTTKQVEAEPAAFLAEALLSNTSDTIERMEKRGQEEFVRSDVLPVRTGNYRDEKVDDGTLLALGFVLGPTVSDDPIFRYAKLPPGWVKVGTDHDMWSAIVDQRGRERISIFYKAAFYDRNAHFLVNRYYHAREDFVDVQDSDAGTYGKVLDHAGKEIHRTEVATRATKEAFHAEAVRNRNFAASCPTAGQRAEAWLDENRPRWRDPLAYWDEP